MYLTWLLLLMFFLIVCADSRLTVWFISWETMRATKGPIKSFYAWKIVEDNVAGLLWPNPPHLTRRSNRSLSRVEQEGQPVSPEMKYWQMTSLRVHVHVLLELFSAHTCRITDLINLAWMQHAWGWDIATWARYLISFVYSSTLPLTYSSVNVLNPRAAPRCRLRSVVTCTSVSANRWGGSCFTFFFHHMIGFECIWIISKQKPLFKKVSLSLVRGGLISTPNCCLTVTVLASTQLKWPPAVSPLYKLTDNSQ